MKTPLERITEAVNRAHTAEILLKPDLLVDLLDVVSEDAQRATLSADVGRLAIPRGHQRVVLLCDGDGTRWRHDIPVVAPNPGPRPLGSGEQMIKFA